MKFTSIFFATSVSILEIYLKDTNKRVPTRYESVGCDEGRFIFPEE